MLYDMFSVKQTPVNCGCQPFASRDEIHVARTAESQYDIAVFCNRNDPKTMAHFTIPESYGCKLTNAQSTSRKLCFTLSSKIKCEWKDS